MNIQCLSITVNYILRVPLVCKNNDNSLYNYSSVKGGTAWIGEKVRTPGQKKKKKITQILFVRTLE